MCLLSCLSAKHSGLERADPRPLLPWLPPHVTQTSSACPGEEASVPLFPWTFSNSLGCRLVGSILGSHSHGWNGRVREPYSVPCWTRDNPRVSMFVSLSLLGVQALMRLKTIKGNQRIWVKVWKSSPPLSFVEVPAPSSPSVGGSSDLVWKWGLQMP